MSVFDVLEPRVAPLIILDESRT